MIRYFAGPTPLHVYRQQLEEIIHHGEDVTVRGKRTRELLNCITEITEPRNRIQVIPGRRLNPWLALSEGLWLLAGRRDLAALVPYNKRISDYSDDGHELYGAYGYRLRDQIMPTLERLCADPADRRAVMTIWRQEDLLVKTKDAPCNDMLMFKVREGALHMSVFCRSNDLHWGLQAVNLPEFSMLQEYLAARLGVGLGTQLHFSQSLHIYLDGPAAEITERMLAGPPSVPQWLPSSPLWGDLNDVAGYTHEEFQQDCSAVLDTARLSNTPKHDGLAFLEFSCDFLRYYRERPPISLSSACRHAGRFRDWIAVGEEWLAGK